MADLRPRGGASHYSAQRITGQVCDLPAPVTKALTGSHAWQRLNRFAAAVGYQTLSDAPSTSASRSRPWSPRSTAWNATSADPCSNAPNADGR